jgi:hypothetical protein
VWWKVEGNEHLIEKLLSSDSTDLLGDPETADAHMKTHYAQVFHFITAAIDTVLEEQNVTSDGITDDIDNIVVKDRIESECKECTTCHKLYPKTKRKCDVCHENLPTKKVSVSVTTTTTSNRKNHETTRKINLNVGTARSDPDKELKERYSHIKSFHPNHPLPTTMMDPVFVNPNSVASIVLVLRKIGQQAGLTPYGGTTRKWVSVCCDGLPYGLVLQIIRNYFVCGLCKFGCMGKDVLSQHKSTKHPDTGDLEFTREFSWVHLMVGDGHYDMHLMKAFVELNWEVFMKDLVIVMGWKSEAALQSAGKCYDNHKTWQLLMTFYFGTLQELIVPYVRSSLRNDVQPTPTGFLSCCKSQGPNYSYMVLMVLRFGQGIFNFRMAIRRNNYALDQSARFCTKELFHGRTHPKYQAIEIQNAFQSIVMPPPIKEFLSQHVSVSKSGDPSKGQGLDFILEEDNAEIKKWIRRGVINNQTWINVCRNKDRLVAIRDRVSAV